MFLTFFCINIYKLCINVIGPTSTRFQYIDSKGNQKTVPSLSSTSSNQINDATNIPFAYQFIFPGCRFNQSGEVTQNQICPKVDGNYLQNICSIKSFPKYLEKTYIDVKNDIEYEDVQLFLYINSEYNKIPKGDNSRWSNTAKYFTTDLYIKSNLCTEYTKLGTIESYSDKSYQYSIKNSHIPDKCIKSSTYYYLKVKNNFENDYQLYAKYLGNYEKISSGETYSKESKSEFTIGFYIKSSKCQTYTHIGDVTSTLNEKIKTFSINDIPNECKINDDGGDDRSDDGDNDGPCLSNGKIYSIENKLSVAVQSNFKNQCPNAEKLIIKGGSTITFQSGNAFRNSKLKEIEMSASTSITIQSDAFENIASLKSLSLKSNIVAIQGTAFKGTGLTEITLSGTNTVSIQSSAFRRCKSLNSVYLIGKIVSVQGLSFSHCSNLNSFTIEATTSAAIQSNVFCGCESLIKDNIDVTASIVDISTNAFSCDNDYDDNDDDDDDDDGDIDALEPIKYILPARKDGKLRPIDITIVDEEGDPKVSYAKQLLEVLPITLYSKIDDKTNLADFNIIINYDKKKFSVDKSNLPYEMSNLVVEKNINNNNNNQKLKKLIFIAGVAVAAVVIIVIIIVVVVVVTKKKKNNEKSAKSEQEMMSNI